MVILSISGAKAELLKNLMLLLPAFRGIVTDTGVPGAFQVVPETVNGIAVPPLTLIENERVPLTT